MRNGILLEKGHAHALHSLDLVRDRVNVPEPPCFMQVEQGHLLVAPILRRLGEHPCGVKCELAVADARSRRALHRDSFAEAGHDGA